MKKVQDIKGLVVNDITVIGDEYTKGGKKFVKVQCVCGTTKDVRKDQVTSKSEKYQIKNCGKKCTGAPVVKEEKKVEEVKVENIKTQKDFLTTVGDILTGKVVATKATKKKASTKKEKATKDKKASKKREYIKGTGKRLTEEEVLELREMYSTGEYTYAELAKQYGMTRNAIGRAIRGITHSEISA